MQELIDLETQGWQVLSTRGDSAKRFYSSVLREDAIMLFPGDLVIAGREAILESLSDVPWKSFDMQDPRLLPLSDDSAVLVYRVVARREGKDPYVALISSTYARGGGSWQLMLHQQTPA